MRNPHREGLCGTREHGAIEANHLEAGQHRERGCSAPGQLSVGHSPFEAQPVEGTQTLHGSNLARHRLGGARPLLEATALAQHYAQDDGRIEVDPHGRSALTAISPQRFEGSFIDVPGGWSGTVRTDAKVTRGGMS